MSPGGKIDNFQFASYTVKQSVHNDGCCCRIHWYDFFILTVDIVIKTRQKTNMPTTPWKGTVLFKIITSGFNLNQTFTRSYLIAKYPIYEKFNFVLERCFTRTRTNAFVYRLSDLVWNTVSVYLVTHLNATGKTILFPRNEKLALCNNKWSAVLGLVVCWCVIKRCHSNLEVNYVLNN